LVYTLPFTKENAQKLFDLRDTKQDNNNSIQFIVKVEGQAVYNVKPQLTLQDTFKLFVESDFNYLFHGNYIPAADKLLAMRRAEFDGLIPKQTDDERAAAILAEQALSQKDKMASYG
jgi:hypothetical protein